VTLTRDTVLAALARHIGERHGIHVSQLVDEIVRRSDSGSAAEFTRGQFWRERLERQIRNLVTELRRDGHHICAHPSTGYFMAETAEELDRTCLFLYDRAMASLQQVAAMRKISLPDLRGQLHLPT
jgi:hypothetical protein